LTFASSDWTDVVFVGERRGEKCVTAGSSAVEISRFVPGEDNILDFVTDNKYIFIGNNSFTGRPEFRKTRLVNRTLIL